MKKIILSLFLLCLMSMTALALVQYTGQPQAPYIVFGKVNWNGQLLAGARMQITNQNTGFTKQISTDGDGYYQEDTGNWLTSAGARPPVMFGDIIIIKVIDGCGTGDTCQKTFSALDGDYANWASLDFSITGTLTCPPISCPSCGGGSHCSGSSGTITAMCTQQQCVDKYPALVPTVCPISTPYTCPVSTPGVCPTPKECPTPTVCEAIPVNTCPDNKSPLGAVLTAIITFIAGGGIAYITLGNNKVKVKKVNGVNVAYHQHPGTSGYHLPSVLHKVQPHKKDELLPKYTKDASGHWIYQP
jgi:hypothetical protein